MLTKDGKSDVFFKLQVQNGTWYTAQYEDFAVANESENYRMAVKTLSYLGTAGTDSIVLLLSNTFLFWQVLCITHHFVFHFVHILEATIKSLRRNLCIYK